MLADNLQEQRARRGGRQQLPVNAHDPEGALHSRLSHDNGGIGEQSVEGRELLLEEIIDVGHRGVGVLKRHGFDEQQRLSGVCG